MLFETEEVCDLCELPVTTLNEWVSKGVVMPTRKGGKGRGNSHRFAGKQVLGLAVAAALHQGERGCSPQYVAKLMRLFEAMDDRTFEALLSPASPWAEELVNAWASREVPEKAR